MYPYQQFPQTIWFVFFLATRTVHKFIEQETVEPSQTDISVDEFGDAILRGMGWSEGKPIGCGQTRFPLLIT